MGCVRFCGRKEGKEEGGCSCEFVGMRGLGCEGHAVLL